MKRDSFQQQIVDRIPTHIVIYNIQTGEYIYANEAASKFLGYPKPQILAGGFAFVTSLLHPEDEKRIIDEVKKFVQTANQVGTSAPTIITSEYRIRRYDGEYRWLHADRSVFRRDSNGNVELIVNVAVDITERKLQELSETKQREKAQRQQEIFHEHQLRAISTRAQLADVLRKEIELKPMLEEGLEVIVRNLPATFSRLWLFDADGQYLNLVASAGHYPPTNTIRSKTKLGEYAVGIVAAQNKPIIINDIYSNELIRIQNTQWAQENNITSFAGYPLFFKDQSIGVITVFSDKTLTENALDVLENTSNVLAQEIVRRTIEQQLKQLSKQKDDFIAIASHELKTPVTSIKVFTQVLETAFRKAGDARSAGLLQKLDSQVNKLTELINDLLDVSHIESGRLQYKIESFTLSDLLEEIASQMQQLTNKHSIQYDFQIDATVAGDRERIGQVLINFLSNAFKYSPNPSTIHLRSYKKNRSVTVEVEDCGIGISTRNQQKLFQRFYRTASASENNYPGLGLGLYISSEIIKRHKGKIGVRSKEGKGSTFYFQLPLAKDSN